MKKELAKLTKGDVTKMGHALRHRTLQEVISVCQGKIYANFGDCVPVPMRSRCKDNYRLAMAIRNYYQAHEQHLRGHYSFAALLMIIKRKLLTQTHCIEDTIIEAERTKTINEKATDCLQKLFKDLKHES